MRRLPLVAAGSLVTLLAFTLLSVGYAQSLPSSSTSIYLPLVLRPAEAMTATTVPTATAGPSLATATPLRTSTPTATQTPTATTGTSSGFPPVGAGTPTRTQVVPSKPIFTNGQDLWNCGDFGTWNDAQVVYQANLPDDPNHLDQNNDGSACDSLPHAP